MARQKDNLRHKVSETHDGLMLMVSFRGNTPIVTAATDTMVEIDADDNPTWVYMALHEIVCDIVSEYDNRTVGELRKIINQQVSKGFASGVKRRRKRGVK